MFVAGLGAVFFGITIGWMTYRIRRFKAGTPGLSDLVAILGAIGGAAVLVFKSDVLFGWYSIGLIIGFFAYFAVGLGLLGRLEVLPRRSEQTPPASTPDTWSDAHEN